MQKNNYLLAGLGAAAVSVLSVGGYLLHRKTLKNRLREQAWRLSMIDFDDDEDYYDDYGDDDSDGDYYDEMFGGLDKGGFFNHNKQGAGNE